MNQDFRDLLAEFNAHGVEYLVVGAHALAAHGHVRATKDLDVWVRPERANANRVIAALRAFGAPLRVLTTKWSEALAFDTRQHSFTFWSDPTDLKEKLTARIRALGFDAARNRGQR